MPASFGCAGGCRTTHRRNTSRGNWCGQRRVGGANYEEARGAESRADFIHKVGIANKELREALYWLRLTEEAALVTDSDLAALIREADELVAILTASIRTAKQRDVTLCGEGRSWRTRDGEEPGSWYRVAPSE